MEPWYKIVTPRKEVREGRSFNPDEFAIALEQVVAGTAPDDYKKPEQFFARTCFTRALVENSGLVLRRLAGKTENTAPVQTLVTQMGGGKTHMLTSLWHLANGGPAVAGCPGVAGLLNEAGLTEVPKAKVAVFVGNAWDPQPGRETPWIDVARQLAGDEGVAALGPSAKEAPPGTDTINRVIALVEGPVLLLFDELLNVFNRHRALAEPMHAFLHNIVRGFIGTAHRAAVFSLPRSEVEMTDWDQHWQGKIVKVVGAVAKPLLVTDEGEISEVIRRRLFEDLGPERTRRNVAKAYADWCFERRAQLPPEWTAVDTTATEKKAREFLQSRFEACFPFHPATLSVFQRKWRPLPQFQQTRGTLAMFAQWISLAQTDAYRKADKSPLLTLGSAPLAASAFRSVVLGQLGETRLSAAIETDIAGDHCHARALDADTKGVLRDIHRRVGSAILFESTGGQISKVAHTTDLRFALGEPELDTTTVDTAALKLESNSFFIQKVGTDGFKVFHKAKIDKAVHDRKASLDEDSEIRPTLRAMVHAEFQRGASIPVEPFPTDSAAVADSPRLNLVLMGPEYEWDGGAAMRDQITDWTKKRGKQDRLYPGALVWCLRKPGRDLREKVELLLAWRRVQRDVREGIFGAEFEKADLQEIAVKVKESEDDAKDEVWASYRFAVLAESGDSSSQRVSIETSPAEGITRAGEQASRASLKVIDLGAGHSSAAETLCGRIISALKAEALLNETVGVGYIDRNWPPAFKSSGAWPLASLRQSFLNGALTRLLDPDNVLRAKIVEFVGHGDFGLASGPKPDGTYEHVWYEQLIPSDEVTFENGVLLLTKAKAKSLKSPPAPTPKPEKKEMESGQVDKTEHETEETTETKRPEAEPKPTTRTFRLTGTIPSEVWNRLGTKLISKLRSGTDLRVGVNFSVTFDAEAAKNMETEIRQALQDLGLENAIKLE